MEERGNVLMQKYEFGRMLGKGSFAKVFYGRNLETGQSVAIKAINKEKILKAGLIDQTKREISIMSMIQHPNVMQLYEVMATKNKIYFIIEYAKGGELFNKIAKGRLREDAARKYFQQLISAVDFCHSRDVYHRDLKPENLLLDECGVLKVADFGLSALAESRRQDGLLHTACGTPAYVAPEVISRKGYDGAKSDIWSCGVILYALLAGYLPFNESNVMDMYRKIGKAEYKCPTWFPHDVRKLLAKILDPNPDTRISIAKIKGNSWFKKGLASKSSKINGEATRAVHIDADVVSGASYNIDTVNVPKQVSGKPANLNAFDIISLSTGFDMSGLFTETTQKKEVQFTSKHSASDIMSKLENIAMRLKLKVKKKDGGLLRLEGSIEGRKGALAIDAELFEFTPSFHLIEMKKTSGDTLEYQNTLKQDIRPALKDIVWAWNGEQQQNQE